MVERPASFAQKLGQNSEATAVSVGETRSIGPTPVMSYIESSRNWLNRSRILGLQQLGTDLLCIGKRVDAAEIAGH